jgi:hypothetical protein
MVYASTKTVLIKIVQVLEAPGEIAWEEQVESGNECLYELHQMTRSSFQAYEVNSKWPKKGPCRVDVNVVLVHAKAMVRAIRRKDRAGALISGRAAIDAM